MDKSDIVTGAGLSGVARTAVDRDRPASTFETQKLPPEPEYALESSWAALPYKASNAYLAPSNTKYPESQSSAAADVFFIHPTTVYNAQDNWNIPIDDMAAVRDIDFILAFFVGVFNAAGKIYAPRYREANMYAFFDDKSTSGVRAVELAYRDIERAFLYYAKFYNQGRPFILAGHSQGSMHGLRLLQERIMGSQLRERMVAAYLIGGTIPKDIPGTKPSRSAADTGVIIGWNTYTKDGDPSVFTDGLITWIGGSYVKIGGRPLLQVNPLSWELNGPQTPPLHNPGSLPFPDATDITPLLLPGICGADASGKVLVINKPAARGFASPKSGDNPVFNSMYGDYHIFDYSLFYESIRKNAVERVKAFLV